MTARASVQFDLLVLEKLYVLQLAIHHLAFPCVYTTRAYPRLLCKYIYCHVFSFVALLCDTSFSLPSNTLLTFVHTCGIFVLYQLFSPLAYSFPDLYIKYQRNVVYAVVFVFSTPKYQTVSSHRFWCIVVGHQVNRKCCASKH